MNRRNLALALVLPAAALVFLVAQFGYRLFPPEPDRAMPVPEAAPPPGVPGALAVVEGLVRDEAGAPLAGIGVRGCGGESISDESGAFRLDVPAGACRVEPSKDVGRWRLVGESAPVTPALGRPIQVALLFVPVHATYVDPGTLATVWLIGADPGGLRVQSVAEDRAAARGIAAGTLLTEIGGVPLVGSFEERLRLADPYLEPR